MHPNYNCLIADRMHLSIVPMLEAIGIQPDYQPEIKRDEILGIIGKYDGIILRSKTFIDSEFLARAERLKFIGRAGAGLDLLDLKEIRKRNIQIINAPEGNRDALAEHAMGLLLSMLNKICVANSQVKSGIWDREGNRGVELKGKNVALMGFGYMGRAFAQRLSSFGCRVMAYDKYKSYFYNEFVKICSLEEIFEEADILSVHVPLTEETEYIIDEEFLNKFRKSIYFLNTARGEMIKLSVLQQAIQSGKIIGAALDVLENEKLDKLTQEQKSAFDFLQKSDKVIFTPHVAGWTHESYKKINEVLVEKLKKLDQPSLL
jgi:D-3-phosphoglycerate dehydrogenase / 2-oxoglutarate reductase